MTDSWTVSVHTNIADISPEDWDRCAGMDNPYVRHCHLLALEESGIASPENGFHPRHILMRDRKNKAVAAAPAYLKDHSEGELGIDLGLALAHSRVAGSYYPKLQVEVPMTPISGPRLLVHAAVDEDEARGALLVALRQQAKKDGASSVQVTYMTAPEWEATDAAGFLKTEGNAYIWRNSGNESFEDVLASMHKRGRVKVRRERKKVASEGLTYKQFTGANITAELVAPFYDLYAATYHRNETELWHNRAYFEHIFRSMPEALDITFAYQGGDPIAMQLSFLGEDMLFAQHWGQSADIRFLLFELGTYQTIESAIRLGIPAINFGTTGQYKAERGIGMEPAYHSLWFRSEDFREISEMGLKRKRAAAEKERAIETSRLPYKMTAAEGGGE
ncbi:GNAT family N-acetyltransferase [uncultured Sneathiella sp.]|uniref:GNAT family N-acetyltransferase n=1 Tax=uncultured Sneathiella sp. TaxID=879315 RepID=UPI0025998754|nr:GNAT family N-acetyltransferase [uncultured Sneathiella sp.]